MTLASSLALLLTVAATANAQNVITTIAGAESNTVTIAVR